MTDDLAELKRFVRGECDPVHLSHREHVRIAFEMLRRHSFPEAVLHYSRALRAVAERVGKSQAYHETVTIAFLSLISERLFSGDYPDFDHFERINPDLFNKGVLRNWYHPDRLATELARRTFVLPEPRQCPATLLRIYRLVFAVLTIVASLQALLTQSHHAVLVAPLEICGAFLFLWRRTQIAGAGLLLLVFALAGMIETIHGEFPAHLLQYGASTVFILLLGRREANRIKGAQ